MSSLTGISPNNPNRYLGPNIAIPSVVSRNRQPTGGDYRQPENGKLYPLASFWLVGKDPTTGTQGDMWYLSKIVSNVAYWLQIGSGGGGGGGGEFTPNSDVHIFDDFFAGETLATAINPPPLVSANAWKNQNFYPASVTDNEHPGVLNAATLATELFLYLGAPSDVSNNPIGTIKLGGGEIVLNWVFKISTLSNNTNRYIMRLGLGDTASADQANGVYLQYSHNLFGGNWAVKTASASSVTFTATTIPVTTGWHNLQVTVNAAATLCTYVIDGVTAGTQTATIPTAAITPFIDINYTAGASADSDFIVDLMYLNQTLDTAR